MRSAAIFILCVAALVSDEVRALLENESDFLDDAKKDEFFAKLSDAAADDLVKVAVAEFPLLGSAIEYFYTKSKKKSYEELPGIVKQCYVDLRERMIATIATNLELLESTDAVEVFEDVVHLLRYLEYYYQEYVNTALSDYRLKMLQDKCIEMPPYAVTERLARLVRPCATNKWIHPHNTASKQIQYAESNSATGLASGCYLEAFYQNNSDRPLESMEYQAKITRDAALLLVMLSAVCSGELNNGKMFQSTLEHAADTQRIMKTFLKEAVWPDEMQVKVTEILEKHTENPYEAVDLYQIAEEIHNMTTSISAERYAYQVILIAGKNNRLMSKLPASDQLFKTLEINRRMALVHRFPTGNGYHAKIVFALELPSSHCSSEDIAVIGQQNYYVPSPEIISSQPCGYTIKHWRGDGYHISFGDKYSCPDDPLSMRSMMHKNHCNAEILLFV